MHPAREFLQSIPGNLVLLSWLYPRAAFWLLHFLGVQGRLGSLTAATKEIDQNPKRTIFFLDLREDIELESLVKQIQTLVQEPCGSALETNWSAAQLLETPARRWYPVIDYSRCTNCMECIDFCLFGVFGVDHQDHIQVEFPDNCKNGCPACSRVCPEQAILFPDHKTSAIAGGNESIKGKKIDLTQLFADADQLRLAKEERAREMNANSKDDLDKLMDALDSLDL